MNSGIMTHFKKDANLMTQKKNQKEAKQSKTLIIISIVLFFAVISTFLMYSAFGPQPTEGAKTITIQVVDNQQNTASYETHTDAAYLRQAMEETKGLTFVGTEGPYGLMLHTINGVTADYGKNQAWWSIYVNDTLGSYGIDSQPVADGDTFRLQYTTEANAAN